MTTFAFDQIAQNITERVEDPRAAGVDRYVGLEHLDPNSTEIGRWGAPDEVGATKLRFYPDDVIYARRRAYQRKLGIARFDGICSAHALVLRARPEVCLPAFLPYFLLSDQFHQRALEISVGSLSPTINWSTLQSEEFELPDLRRQSEIVEVLKSMDGHLLDLDRTIASSSAFRNANIERELRDGGPLWLNGQLSEFAELNPSCPPLNENTPFVPMDAVRAGERFVTYFERRGTRNGCRAQGGDILFARITPCLENGKTAQVPWDIELCGGSTEFIVIRESEHVTADFLFLWTTWPRVRAEAMSRMTGTTGRQRISAQALGEIQIALPPRNIQERIVEQDRVINDFLTQLNSTREATLKMRNAILAKELSA